MMKIYRVGGCVRDTLLGLTPKDIDYVVVGATPEEMIALGFEKVGASFPVFLKNGEEYALARTERKTGVGYNGFDVVFDPSVTLEDDLIRRDLTINAMAQDMDTGEIIDPYGGAHDLAQGVLRHTSEAFAEDPVRVLRTARFAARYGFTIAADTVGLMRKVAPELAHVPQERIWAEFEKGLSERNPARMLEALEYCDALWVAPLTPYRQWSHHLRKVNDSDGMHVRFSLIARGFTDGDFEACKIPNHLSRVAKAYAQHSSNLVDYVHLSKEDRLDLLTSLKAFNDDQLIAAVLDVVAVSSSPIVTMVTKMAIDRDVDRIKQLDSAAIVASDPKNAKTLIREARLGVL